MSRYVGFITIGLYRYLIRLNCPHAKHIDDRAKL